MTSTATAYSPSLTAAAAREHIDGLLREATASRAAAQLPRRDSHRTKRRRALWWDRVTARSAAPRTA